MINFAIILVLALILPGLYALMRNVTLEGNGKALIQIGFFMMVVLGNDGRDTFNAMAGAATCC